MRPFTGGSCRDSGMDDVVAKPIQRAALAALIRSHLAPTCKPPRPTHTRNRPPCPPPFPLAAPYPS